MSLISECPQQKFEEIIKTSSNYTECIKKLGYSANSGDTLKMLKNRIQELELDTSHFTSKSRIKRTPNNIFVKDSTANQTTLRKWYLKGEYTPYICSICGQEPFWNGQELTLILDHINGHNHDDRLENLRWVCPNCNQQLPTTNGKNQHVNKEKKDNIRLEWERNICPKCGGPKSTSAQVCYKCMEQEKKFEISREELKKLIRTTPFTTIGKQFGVSDNAVKKRCIQLNLPSLKKDIKKYTDEEWELV